MVIGVTFIIYTNIAEPNSVHDHHETDREVTIGFMDSSKDGYITIGPKRHWFIGNTYDKDLLISKISVYKADDEHINKCVYYVRFYDYSLGFVSIFGYGEFAYDFYLDNEFYEKYTELTTSN